MKIAIWHNMPFGGGKRQLYNHVKGLVEAGHYVESWCPDTADQTFLPLSSLIKEHIIPLESFDPEYNSTYRSLKEIMGLVGMMEDNARKCVNEIEKKDFDVIFLNSCKFLRTSAVSKQASLPTILYLPEPYRWFYEALPELPWVHNELVLKGGFLQRHFKSVSPLMEGIQYQARKEYEYARSATKILVNSVYSRESVLRVYGRDSSVCYLGIDTNEYSPSYAEKQPFILGLGTIYHAKGIDRAIRAVAQMQAKQKVKLVWIGNGAWPEDLKSYMDLADSMGVDFECLCNIPDAQVKDNLCKAACLIYTSRLEPFGLAPLEANSCGTAVVAIAEGGVRETIIDGINGYLTKDEDFQQLGNYLSKFINDLGFARDFGLKCRKHVVEHWGLDVGTNHLIQALQRY